MVVLLEGGWLGVAGKLYATPQAAHNSFWEAFHWAYPPQISERDRQEERRLTVFLSYAKEDTAAIRELYHRLLERNTDPWLDEVKLLPGRKWRVEISKEIRKTDAFVACLSETAVSKVGYINREFKEALEIADLQPENKIFLIPLRLQECQVPQ